VTCRTEMIWRRKKWSWTRFVQLGINWILECESRGGYKGIYIYIISYMVVESSNGFLEEKKVEPLIHWIIWVLLNWLLALVCEFLVWRNIRAPNDVLQHSNHCVGMWLIDISLYVQWVPWQKGSAITLPPTEPLQTSSWFTWTWAGQKRPSFSCRYRLLTNQDMHEDSVTLLTCWI